jgi:hypothetical protein
VTTFSAPVLIDPPPPPPRPSGLFDVAMGPMPFPRAEGQVAGVLYVPDVCTDSTFLYEINCPAVSGTKEFTGIETPVSGAPFAVISTYTCGAVGFSFDEASRRVRTRLSLHEQRRVEQRLWQGFGGAFGNMEGLLRGATDLGASGCVTEAIEVLEQALADNAVPGGMIHARPGMNAHLSTSFLVREPARGRFTTGLGTPYVFGQGYDGTGPAGEAVGAGDEYMYATGRVLLWQDPEVFVPDPGQVLNLATNQLSLVAERVYAVAIECGAWVTKVTRNCTTAGSA